MKVLHQFLFLSLFSFQFLKLLVAFSNQIFQGKEIVVSAGTGLMSDNGCGFAVRECRRRSLRRRRSGGPELFASVVRRGNNFTSAHLPPLPQSATCTHAKLKV